MKSSAYVVPTFILSILSFSTLAAQEVRIAPTGQQKIGVINATGGDNLSSVEGELKEKAEAEGASSYIITSISGNNRLHGTATVYR